MTMVSLVIVAVLELSAAVYAQLRIPAHASGEAKVAWARSILIVIGLALGYVGLRTYQESSGIRAVLVFVIGFGVAHVPAALILCLKRFRGSGKS